MAFDNRMLRLVEVLGRVLVCLMGALEIALPDIPKAVLRPAFGTC